jgi:hypothetical protein
MARHHPGRRPPPYRARLRINVSVVHPEQPRPASMACWRAASGHGCRGSRSWRRSGSFTCSAHRRRPGCTAVRLSWRSGRRLQLVRRSIVGGTMYAPVFGESARSRPLVIRAGLGRALAAPGLTSLIGASRRARRGLLAASAEPCGPREASELLDGGEYPLGHQFQRAPRAELLWPSALSDLARPERKNYWPVLAVVAILRAAGCGPLGTVRHGGVQRCCSSRASSAAARG